MPGLATIHGAALQSCSPRPPLLARRGQENGLGEQRLRVERGIGCGRHVVVLVQQRDVERSGPQRIRSAGRVKLGHVQFEFRVLLPQRDEGGGQQRADGSLECPDPQLAGELGPCRRQGRRRLLQQREHWPSSFREIGPGGGKLHPPASAPDQRHARRPLERAQLLRHSGRGIGERVGYGHDRAQPG